MKKGKIELDKQSGEIRIRFPYDRTLLELVRALPRRRFSGDDKSWYVPLSSLPHVMKSLSPVDFTFSRDVMRAAEQEREQTKRQAVERAKIRKEEGATEPEPAAGLSLQPAELNARVRKVLRETFPDPIWIIGELSNWKPNMRRATFFELVERDVGEMMPHAKVRAVMFHEVHKRVAEQLRRMRSKVELRDGLRVRMMGRATLYDRSGSFQLQIEDIDPYYTVYAIIQQREVVLQELRRRGIAELNQQLALPIAPLRVGLITSEGSAACADFVDELQRSNFGFTLHLFDARMQGKNLEHTVSNALDYFAAHADEIDVVVIVRGGGARSELAHFDTLHLGLRLCNMPVPILCGIGHHQDRCIVDDVGRSFKTPTAVAQFLVSMVESVDRELDQLGQQLLPAAQQRVDAATQALTHSAENLAMAVQRLVRGADQQLHHHGQMLDSHTRARLRHERHQLSNEERTLSRAAQDRTRTAHRQLKHEAHTLDQRCRNKLRSANRELQHTRKRMARAAGQQLQHEQRSLDPLSQRFPRAAAALLRHQDQELAHLAALFDARDPKRVLQRGFALVRDTQGKIVKRANTVPPGQTLHITLAQGQLHVATQNNGAADNTETTPQEPHS